MNNRSKSRIASTTATRNDRTAFSLIELLVAVVIIGVLLALILPAVQSARQAARLVTCRNNLKQILLAMQSYETTHQVFPLSYGKGVFSADNTGASWMQLILPQIDQANLFGKLRFGMPLSDPGNTAVAQTVIPVFLCPGDGGNGRMGFRANVPGVWAVNNYKACAGSNWNWGAFSPVASSAGRNANSPDGLDHGNGLIWRGYTGSNIKRWPGGPPPVTRMSDLRDGSGHTFAVGESVPEWCRHTWWYWFNGTTATCAIPLNYKKQPDLQIDSEGDWQHNYSFMSRHPGDANFGLADGSVRFISDSIELSIYRALASVQGGEPVGEF